MTSIKVRATRKNNPTTGQATVVVSWFNGVSRRKTVALDYSATDPFAAAVREVLPQGEFALVSDRGVAREYTWETPDLGILATNEKG